MSTAGVGAGAAELLAGRGQLRKALDLRNSAELTLTQRTIGCFGLSKEQTMPPPIPLSSERAFKILGEITRPLIELDHRWHTEAWITMAEGILECVIQHRGTNVEKGLHGRPVPAHLLFLIHALGHDLVDRTLDERRRDRLTP
jgi:hypothetical protein